MGLKSTRQIDDLLPGHSVPSTAVHHAFSLSGAARSEARREYEATAEYLPAYMGIEYMST